MVTPNDVSKRWSRGRAHYSGLLTDRATYIDDILVYRLAAEDFMVVVNASNAPRDAGVDRVAHADGRAEVTDESERRPAGAARAAGARHAGAARLAGCLQSQVLRLRAGRWTACRR